MSVDSGTLTAGRRWLVQRMRQLVHGSMHDLVVRDGEPVLHPAPKVKQAFKLGGRRNEPKAVSAEFALKQQHIELFELLDAKRSGRISKLMVQDGLPFLVEWEDD